MREEGLNRRFCTEYGAALSVIGCRIVAGTLSADALHEPERCPLSKFETSDIVGLEAPPLTDALATVDIGGIDWDTNRKRVRHRRPLSAAMSSMWMRDP
jgi:hypothetical protein